MARGVEIVLLSYLSGLGCIPSCPVDLEIFVFSFPVSSLFFFSIYFHRFLRGDIDFLYFWYLGIVGEFLFVLTIFNERAYLTFKSKLP